MGRPPNKPPQPVAQEDLPVLESVGWTRTSGGWVVFKIKSQGKVVLSQDLLSEPEMRALASERLKLEVVKQFLLPGGKN
jgi:hypothetical protein